MATCPSCASEVPEDKRFCGDCGAPVDSSSAPTETSFQSEPSAVSYPTPDQARFIPGTVLAKRYRIVGLLGSGGMGEVYRADDIKLGQPVALKFLPQAVQRDQQRLGRFLNEVKTALKVSHPNVCRVHDIGEVDGQHYLSMEYVDGEDLASLLRRIERLPQNKAIQIARQLCAGLAAAHEEGILHRDLKPANVMIDGRGRAKITDFGLAGLAEGIRGDEVRAGTPRYMSPEQHAGREVTVRSDIYSLGLVLYELFTGQRAFEAASSTDVRRLQNESSPTSPSSHVEGLDHAVERIILRCLESVPTQRPPSAIAVAAALPGGDPLAAALAAGETPPPELVAEAGESGGLEPWAAWSCLLASIVCVLLAIQLGGVHKLGRMVPPGKAPHLLTEKARELVFDLGYEAPPQDSTYGYEANRPYLEHLAALNPSPGRWEQLAIGQPPALWFWYRQSPRYLARQNAAIFIASLDDPPATVPGMIETRFDPQGRFRGLQVVPPEGDDAAAAEAEPDWAVLFEAAGFEIDEFTMVEARGTARVFADRRAAWVGTYPDDPHTAIRVEAAAYRGRPVSFTIVEPWTPVASAGASGETLSDRALRYLANVFVLGTLLGGALIAWRNLRLGRGDRKGAWRLAFYLFCVRMLVWLFSADDQLEPSAMGTFMSHLAWALYRFAIVWLFYIAFEPYLRRIWPETMVSWVRLLRGKIKDPLVGRDVLIGILGCALMMLMVPAIVAAGDWLGAAPQPPSTREPTLEALRGLPHAVATMLYVHAWHLLQAGMFGIVFLLLLRLLLRWNWLAVGVFLLITPGVQVATQGVGGVTAWLIFAVLSAIWLLLFFRAGLLSLLVCLGTIGLWAPLTLSLDPGQWYSSGTYLALLLTLGIAAYGFYVSLAGRPILGDPLLDSPRVERT